MKKEIQILFLVSKIQSKHNLTQLAKNSTQLAKTMIIFR